MRYPAARSVPQPAGYCASPPQVSHRLMNAYARPSLGPHQLIISLIKHRNLIWGMAKREVAGRYQGSFLGVFWSFLTPLVMLLVYTFVFSVVFKAKWNIDSTSKTDFALILFAGLIFYNLISEVAMRSTSLITGNSNLVKKVVFPIETLPFALVFASLFHFLISLMVWTLAYIVLNGPPPATLIHLPLLIAPVALMSLGFSWILASIAVYLRDIGQLVALGTMMLLFLSPIFYPIEILPSNFQAILLLNPLTFVVEQARMVMLWGQEPAWSDLAVFYGCSALIAYVGFLWFQKTRGGFADVL